jgi:hypothetical protein
MATWQAMKMKDADQSDYPELMKTGYSSDHRHIILISSPARTSVFLYDKSSEGMRRFRQRTCDAFVAFVTDDVEDDSERPLTPEDLG